MLLANIQSTVVAAIASICRCDASSVELDSSLFDLGVDSLALAAIVAYLQAALETDLTQEQLLTLYRAESLREIIAAMSESEPPHPRPME